MTRFSASACQMKAAPVHIRMPAIIWTALWISFSFSNRHGVVAASRTYYLRSLSPQSPTANLLFWTILYPTTKIPGQPFSTYEPLSGPVECHVIPHGDHASSRPSNPRPSLATNTPAGLDIFQDTPRDARAISVRLLSVVRIPSFSSPISQMDPGAAPRHPDDRSTLQLLHGTKARIIALRTWRRFEQRAMKTKELRRGRFPVVSGRQHRHSRTMARVRSAPRVSVPTMYEPRRADRCVDVESKRETPPVWYAGAASGGGSFAAIDGRGREQECINELLRRSTLRVREHWGGRSSSATADLLIPRLLEARLR